MWYGIELVSGRSMVDIEGRFRVGIRLVTTGHVVLMYCQVYMERACVG